MSLAPLLNASLIIQVHAFAAMIAFGLGPFILFTRKGNTRHRVLGRVWALVMAVTIVSSFFVFGLRMFGPFGPIHFISVFAAFSLVRGINYARKGNITAHRQNMRRLYFLALVIAGVFTFVPGRIMNRMFFAGREEFGFVIVLSTMAICYLALFIAQRRGMLKVF